MAMPKPNINKISHPMSLDLPLLLAKAVVAPQCGHDIAERDNIFPQSGHLIMPVARLLDSELRFQPVLILLVYLIWRTPIFVAVLPH